MNEGDYYRWSYKTLPKGSFEPYWCKSRIALFKQERLVDTYWHGDSPGSKNSWTEAEAECALDLVFVANLSDLVEASRHVHEDNRPEDIVDLSHPNRTQVYLRKGAKRCMDVKRATWRRKRDKAQSEADMWQRMLKHDLL